MPPHWQLAFKLASLQGSFKMAGAVTVLVAVLLLCVSEAISTGCPPDSGKSVDVFSNNVTGFHRYLPDVQRRLLS